MTDKTVNEEEVEVSVLPQERVDTTDVILQQLQSPVVVASTVLSPMRLLLKDAWNRDELRSYPNSLCSFRDCDEPAPERCYFDCWYVLWCDFINPQNCERPFCEKHGTLLVEHQRCIGLTASFMCNYCMRAYQKYRCIQVTCRAITCFVCSILFICLVILMTIILPRTTYYENPDSK